MKFSKLFQTSLFVSAILVSHSAFSCGNDEYEWCWSVGPMKDCKCLPKGPDVLKPVNKTTELCGVEITVSATLYVLCQSALASIPASCTAGAATTGGSSCAVSVGAAAATCGVSVDILAKAADQCIKKAGQ